MDPPSTLSSASCRTPYTSLHIYITQLAPPSTPLSPGQDDSPKHHPPQHRKHPLHKAQYPHWHPKRRADKQRIPAPPKQRHLKNRRRDVLRVAVPEVPQGVAEVVLVEAARDVLRLGPDVEYEVFGRGGVRPETVPGEEGKLVGARDEQSNWGRGHRDETIGEGRKGGTNRVPAGISRIPSSFVNTPSFSFRTTASVPWCTLKYSVCFRWMCLCACQPPPSLPPSLLVIQVSCNGKTESGEVDLGGTLTHSGGPDNPFLTVSFFISCVSLTTNFPSAS